MGQRRGLLTEGCSIVLTTHYLEEAEKLADRITVVTHGRVVASGTVDDMRALVARRQISCDSLLPLEQVRAWPGVVEANRVQDRLHITATDAEGVVRRLLNADPALDKLDVRQAGLNEAFNRTDQGGCMNALALKTLVTLAPRGGDFGAYLTETRFELMRMVRNATVAIPSLLLAPALYALFALVIFRDASSKDANVGNFIFLAFSLMSVTMPSMFGIGVSLALERDMGLLRSQARAARTASSLGGGKDRQRPGVGGRGVRAHRGPGRDRGQTYAPARPDRCAQRRDADRHHPVHRAGTDDRVPGQRDRREQLRPAGLSTWLLPVRHVLPATEVHVLGGTDLATVPCQQLAMHLAGISKFQSEPLVMAIATLLGYTVLFAGVAIWRLQQRG